MQAGGLQRKQIDVWQGLRFAPVGWGHMGHKPAKVQKYSGHKGKGPMPWQLKEKKKAGSGRCALFRFFQHGAEMVG